MNRGGWSPWTIGPFLGIAWSDTPAGSYPLTESAAPMPTENRPLILCIDDGEIPLRVRKLVLDAAGYKVLSALSAEGGFEVFKENPVDLVIADHYLTGKTGTEIDKEMKQLKPEVPILIFSAATERPDGLEYADGFLAKGAAPEVLLKVIASMLRK